MTESEEWDKSKVINCEKTFTRSFSAEAYSFLSPSVHTHSSSSCVQVTLLKFEYLFERFRASNDPFAVDENNAMRGTARGRLAAVVRATDRQKEKGRASRRTVFVDTDWKKFRSSYRIIDNLASFYGMRLYEPRNDHTHSASSTHHPGIITDVDPLSGSRTDAA